MAGEDRTEAPTPKRKKKARDDGQIARSQDLAPWLTIMVASYVLPGMMGGVIGALREGLDAAGDLPRQPEIADATRILASVLRESMLALFPLLIVVTGVSAITSFAQVGNAVSSKAMKPKFAKLNPAKGIKQLVSKKQLWELGKSVAKLSALAAVAYRSVVAITKGLLGSGPIDLGASLAGLSGDVLALVRLCASLGLGIAIVDYGVQKRRTAKEIRMTKQEVKEEHKSSDGDPHMKAKMKGLRMAFSRNRMMASVARADVLLVNPTHVAVAIQYQKAIGVPTIVALGRGAVAARIRALAVEHKVPIVEDKPLARALFSTCDVGDAIPRELFEGVAKVLAFVYALGAAAPTGPTPLRMPGGTVRATPEALGGRHTRGAAKRAAKQRAMAERRAQRQAIGS